MDNLIVQLKNISKEFPIEELYVWDIPEPAPILIPANVKGGYLKNAYLKKNLASKLNSDTSMDTHYWVIHDWGKIRSFRRHPKNNKLIAEFIAQLDKGALLRRTFNLISSLSKVASFMNHREFAIYDSRAVYSLNWLIFTHTQSRELYPQPSGRSKELAKYDMQTIVRLANKDHTYMSHKVAYQHYCKLLKRLSKEVYGDEDPYKIEMLLFLIAPEKIVESIRDSVSINVNTTS
ncbi:hypothetical protein ACFL3W_00115 [Pseudomonadota bacterium]